MIFVDNANIEHNGKIWHHMTSDTSIEELHLFAEKLGLKREYFQDKNHFYHYDITENKFNMAISMGAIVVDARTLVHYAKKLYYDNKNKNENNEI
jgi:hypothetical protein